MGNNESFECYTTNIYTRTTLAGDFVLVNKYLIQDLIDLGLWNSDMKDKIIYHHGSVQNIQEIPQNIRDLYKTVWEISQKVVIDQAADRGPFVCQSQSMNLYFQNPSYAKISSALLYAWSRGLKTLSYYTRSKTAVKAQQYSLDATKVKEIEQKNDEVCESCSG
jgi:ribonucleoside-diphosphate reductase alpha chain